MAISCENNNSGLSAANNTPWALNWDADNYETYDPLPYVLANEIIRKPPGLMTKTQKKQFKESERERMKKYVVKTQPHVTDENTSPVRNRATAVNVPYEENLDGDNYYQTQTPHETFWDENCNTSPERNHIAPTTTVNVPNEENWDENNHYRTDTPHESFWDGSCEENLDVDNYYQTDTPHQTFWNGSCEENWDSDKYTTYNPLPHVLANNIIRQPPANLPREEKKQFKQNERERMKKFVNKTKP